ncbi:ELAV-like protein 1-A [Paramacrobiotus metropolitanus]|uniref:ELAV-like protein 1-A n=1 Tax=Paramacrobiotus metropolitanus TaxID=2943436 RepID=UPI002445A322|nr:ELAV-like protein 1-A [Paramacrobiotus metropolitanus]
MSRITANVAAGAADLPVETPSAEPADGRKLIVNYLPSFVRDGFLRKIFATPKILENATLEECRVVMRKDDAGRDVSRGFAFLTYSHADAAKRAMDLLDGFCLIESAAPWEVDADGNPTRKVKHLKVSYCRPSDDAYRQTNLFVTGIPCAWQLEDLKCHFRQWGGSVISCTIAPRNTCLCRSGEESAVPCDETNWGFVRFARHAQALTAREECQKMHVTASNPLLLLRVTLLDDSNPRLPRSSSAPPSRAGFQQQRR